ncbi:MAG: aspartate--tRNA ligase [Clostridiales Family XIII bacterium]|nr:aspartate--tRNA ligase [Clostridiales Family XIII bacterium]
MNCNTIGDAHIDTSVRLAGFIRTIRNHGGIVFVDLYDQYGTTQVVVTDEQVKDLVKESAISVYGKVVKRDEETINNKIATGQVELVAETIEVQGKSKNALPFEIESSRDTNEELRLRYRYLDLRNDKLKENLLLRTSVIKKLRSEMEDLGFLEIQTPILANSSPEGARDYLVPSRKHHGKFYALPQAPQQFKQLLMVSGFDKYFQIAPCFRDEDARLDRSPGEFYQLDFEMAWATQEDVFAVADRVLYNTFVTFTDKEVSKPPFRRISFKESMLKYGSDKPDLRNPLEIIDLSDFFANVDFAPFRGKIVRGLSVPGMSSKSKKFFKEMEKFAISIGMKGLGYVSVEDDLSLKGPIDKFLSDAQRAEVKELAGLQAGDVLYFISDDVKVVSKYAGEIRTEVAKRMDLIDTSKYEFCYIVDFPMYEINEDTGKIDFTHNPFSMPQGEMDALQNKDPLEINAYQYDIVVNGVELSSGAVRNHRPDIMVKAFEIAGYTAADVEEKFGALYTAFQYGAPPHAGMAPGVDRIVMLLAGEENIREIIAFPLNSNAQNLMLDAPSVVSEQQLRDVHIKIR